MRRSVKFRKQERPGGAAATVNLLAQDTERIADFSRLLHRLWTAPVLIFAGLGYMSRSPLHGRVPRSTRGLWNRRLRCGIGSVQNRPGQKCLKASWSTGALVSRIEKSPAAFRKV